MHRSRHTMRTSRVRITIGEMCWSWEAVHERLNQRSIGDARLHKQEQVGQMFSSGEISIADNN